MSWPEASPSQPSGLLESQCGNRVVDHETVSRVVTPRGSVISTTTAAASFGTHAIGATRARLGRVVSEDRVWLRIRLGHRAGKQRQIGPAYTPRDDRGIGHDDAYGEDMRALVTVASSVTSAQKADRRSEAVLMCVGQHGR